MIVNVLFAKLVEVFGSCSGLPVGSQEYWGPKRVADGRFRE